MTQYTDGTALNGRTFDSSYFYSASASSAEAGSVNGAVYYAGTVSASGSAGISGTISSSGNGYFTLTPASGAPTTYQILGSTADGRNLVFEAAQGQGSNTGPYYILSGNAAAPASPLNYDSRNSYQAPAPVCFAAGTLIATPHGEVAVETLAVGDTIVTASGRLRPVRWVGGTRIHIAATKRPSDIFPVAFRRGALGENVPSRDLLVSPGHRILIDGMLFQAESLVNGMTIVRHPVETINYHHVELDEPDALLANGAPAESFVDVGNRASFNDAIGLPAAAARIDADPLTETFAPNIKSGPLLAGVRGALVERALAQGWSRIVDRSVAIAVSGVRIEAAAIVGNRHWFILPEAATDIRVLSQSAVCSQIKPETDDDRRLGVQILGVVADGREVHLHSPVFGAGFHDCEEDGDALFRWIDGNAELTLRRPARVVEIAIGRGAELVRTDASIAIAA